MVRLIFRINIKYKQKNISCYSGYPDEMQLATNLSKRGFHLRWGSRFLYWEIWGIEAFEDLKDLKIWKIWGIWRIWRVSGVSSCFLFTKKQRKNRIMRPFPLRILPFQKGKIIAEWRSSGFGNEFDSLKRFEDLRIWRVEGYSLTTVTSNNFFYFH